MKTKNFRIILAVCLTLFAGTVINTKAQKAELVVQTGHSSTVSSVAFSSDGKTLASGGEDRIIKLWDVESGKEIRTLKGHSDTIFSISFSSDGKTLASGSRDNTIKLWDVETGKELRTLKGHSSFVRSVSFSSDGKTLASGSSDNTIKLWDVETGKESQTLTGHSDYVNSVAFSSDRKTLASGSSDKTIKLWDVERGKVLKTLKGNADNVELVLFSADGKTLASASSDITIKLWDVESGKELRTLKGHSAPVWSFSFSSDGKLLASGSFDNTIKLWNLETGIELRTLTGHAGSVSSVSFSPDGKIFASGSHDRTLKLWDVRSGKELRTLTGDPHPVSSVSFSPDGKTLAGGSGTAIKLWDAESGTELRTLTGHSYIVSSVAFTADGKTLASGSYDKTIKLWDVKTGRELRTLAPDSDWVLSVSFSPDGKTLASGHLLNTIKLWDVASGKELGTLAGHSSYVSSVEFSSDGKILASGNGDKTIKLWDVASGKELRTLAGHADSVGSVSFSPNGITLASGSGDKTIKLWDVKSGKQLRTLTGHSAPVSSVSFSQDGKTLASGSEDRTIRLWDVETGKELRTLMEHSDRVMSISFSSDGKTFASGSADTKTKIWNISTGEEICSLIAIGGSDWAVTTPEGRFDTNKIEDSQGLHWVVSDDPLKPIPLEVFMRDHYEPKLFPRLIQCNKLNNCDREFKPVRDISKLNRVQPPVEIKNVSMPDAEGYVNVTVEVGRSVGKYLVDGAESRRATGVYDVRLFRDRQMVGTWPSDGAEKLLHRTPKDSELNDEATGGKRFLEELRDWRGATEVKPDEAVKIDQRTGMFALPPFRVKLPRGKDASQIEFSAYAFNEDRVKSQTAKREWPSEVVAQLPKAQLIKPRAYVIAVGVNAYENSDFDLEFAADDARRMSAVIAAKLAAIDHYGTVTPVTLISDYETREGRRILTEKQATKDKFHAVLDLLAGKNIDRQLLAGVKNADQLQRATPDDLVLIMYSSHGYADRAGNFYFIPYDTGPGTGKVFTETVRRHSISSEELSLWLRDVDAGEMIMIVDACHSAAAIEGSDFKPGPMGSRGLGQLSYDKGMRILTATQADNLALENNLIKQGLLTYALVRDGLEAGQADYKPKDNVINLGEWLSYGVDRVPKLYEEVQAGKIQEFGIVAGRQTKVVMAGQSGKSKGKTLEEVVIEAKAQQPSLFDFTRRHREVALVK